MINEQSNLSTLNTNNEKSSNKKGLKVLGVGLYRTGNLSLKTALEILGFNKCYHMFEFCERPQDMETWRDILYKKGNPDYDKLFEGYEAAVDAPACTAWEQLYEKYPDMKIIINTRDPKSWYKSAKTNLYEKIKEWQIPYPQTEVWDTYHYDIEMEGKYMDEDYAIDFFHKHYDKVRKTIPEKQRLEFQVKDGWKPLCEFLGVEIPNVPFPHVNDSDSIQGKLQEEINKVSKLNEK